MFKTIGEACKGDSVQLVYRGENVTGRVFRVKKDGTRSIQIDVDEGEDPIWVDIKSAVA